MDISELHIGMVCHTKKGSGTVAKIDVCTEQVYLTDMQENESFSVELDEIMDDPQSHGCNDIYY